MEIAFMISPEQSSLSFTSSLKLFITQIYDQSFGLIPQNVRLYMYNNAKGQLRQKHGRALNIEEFERPWKQFPSL